MNLCDEKVILCYGVQYYFTLEILYNYLCEPVRKLIYTHTYIYVGSQIVAHTLIETGNGPNRPITIDL